MQKVEQHCFQIVYLLINIIFILFVLVIDTHLLLLRFYSRCEFLCRRKGHHFSLNKALSQPVSCIMVAQLDFITYRVRNGEKGTVGLGVSFKKKKFNGD